MSRYFPLILISVVALTVLCGAGAGFIAVVYGNSMSPSLAGFQQNLSCLFTAGAGAVIGLLGGRASASSKI